MKDPHSQLFGDPDVGAIHVCTTSEAAALLVQALRGSVERVLGRSA